MRDLTKEDSDAMTIGEYAEANDLQMAIVGISTAAAAEGAEDIVASIDWRMEADGTLVFMLSGDAPQGAGDAFETTLLCSVTPLVSAPEGEGISMQYFEEGAEEPVRKYIGYAVDERISSAANWPSRSPPPSRLQRGHTIWTPRTRAAACAWSA